MKLLFSLKDQPPEHAIVTNHDVTPFHNNTFIELAGLLILLLAIFMIYNQAPKIRNQQVVFNWFTLSSFIAILGSFCSLAYLKILQVFIHLVWTQLPRALHGSAFLFSSHPEYCVVLITTLGGLLWAGVAHVIRAPSPAMNMNKWIEGILSTGEVEPRAFFFPALILSMINVVVGSAIGPEAPLVFAGSAIGTQIARLAHQDEVTTRVASLCGGASMLAVFFGFPVAPAFFVLEMPHRSGLQHWECLMPVIWATVVSTFVSRAFQGAEYMCDPTRMGFTCFSFTAQASIHESKMLLAVVYGVVAAAVAILQISLIQNTKAGLSSIVARFSIPEPAVITLGGFVVGILGIFFPLTLFWGEFQMQALMAADPGDFPVPWIYDLMLSQRVIFNSPQAHYLVMALSKALSIAICVAMGYCGGVVFPVMLVGLGFSNVLFPGDEIAMMCIMFGVVAAVCRVPITAIVLAAFSMRPKLSILPAEGALAGIGATLTSLSICVIVATVSTAWYPFFQTGDRKDALSPFRDDAQSAGSAWWKRFLNPTVSFGPAGPPPQSKDGTAKAQPKAESSLPGESDKGAKLEHPKEEAQPALAKKGEHKALADQSIHGAHFLTMEKILRQLLSFPEEGPVPAAAKWVLGVRIAMLIFSIYMCVYFVGAVARHKFLWVPFMTFGGCLLSSAGVPVAGGTVYFPIMTLMGLSPDISVFFTVATQVVSCGILTPMAWVGTDASVFIKPAFLYSFPGGLLGVVFGTWLVPLHGAAIKLFFTIAMAFLLCYTIHGLFHTIATQDERLKIERHSVKLQLVVSGLVGGVLVAYIGIGIEKVLFFILTLHGVNAVKACISGITMCGALCLITTLGKCQHSTLTFPLDLWLLGIPGLIVGSIIGPLMNRSLGPKRILCVFICLLAFDVGKHAVGYINAGVHHHHHH